MKKNLIILTMGEPGGIGPQVLLRSFKAISGKTKVIAISDFYKIKHLAKRLDVKIRKITKISEACFKSRELNILHLEYQAPFIQGKYNQKNSKAVINSIKLASQLCLNKEVDAMVTGPINKYILKKGGGFRFRGHTDYLEYLCNKKADSALMMMTNTKLKIIPLTIHVPLKKVSSLITKQRLKETLRKITNELKTKFNIKYPKIAVLGLNPHSGENGDIGKEEIQSIIPVISDLNKTRDFNIFGPFPADGYFGSKAFEDYDATLAMYHDQALIPLKLLGFFESVNITMGLPIIRTSPGHGSAIELAKKGKASEESFLAAIRLANTLITRKLTNKTKYQNE